MKTLLKVLSGIVITLLIAVGGAVYALTTETVQQWLYTRGIEMLSEKLNTHVEVKKVGVDFRRGGVYLYDFEMRDRQNVTMLRVDTLEASVQLLPLLQREVNIDGIYLHGVRAVLYKERPDTAANYQFVIDAFKKKDRKTKKHDLELNATLKTFDVARCDFSWDVKSLPAKGAGRFDPAHVDICNFGVKISGNIMSEKMAGVTIRDLHGTDAASGAVIGNKKLTFRTIGTHSTTMTLCGVSLDIPGKHLHIDTLDVLKSGALKTLNNEITLKARGIEYRCNNGKPRKNVGKPHRGFFDAGHLNVRGNADLTIQDFRKDSVTMKVNSLKATDRGSGLIVKNLTALIEKQGKDIYVKGLKIAMPKTRLKMGTVHLTLTKTNTNAKTKSKTGTEMQTGAKARTKVTIAPVVVTANVYLTDIAKPFAPVLNRFTTPLNLRVTCCGNLDRILFKDILITSAKKRLVLTAQGDLCDVTKKKKLSLHFWNINMTARGGIKEQIVGHFKKKVNLKMQRQMKLLGDIRYKGKVVILYKREDISGTLFTKFGDATFAFTLNGFTKYMTGTLQVTGFEIGKLMKIDRLGPISAEFKYSFNTSKKKLRQKGVKGKLPQGTLSAKIDGAKFHVIDSRLISKWMGFKHITGELQSDGKTAKGTIIVQQKVRDIAIDFSYYQTAQKQSYSYKVRLQKISDDDKASRKVRRQEEKELRKAEKAAAKERRKAEKAAAKAGAEAKAEAETRGEKPKRKKFLGIF